jgi:hypothetical protein
MFLWEVDVSNDITVTALLTLNPASLYAQIIISIRGGPRSKKSISSPSVTSNNYRAVLMTYPENKDLLLVWRLVGQIDVRCQYSVT